MGNKTLRCVRSFPSMWGYDLYSKGNLYCVTISDQVKNKYRSEGNDRRTYTFESKVFKKIFGSEFKYGK